MTPSATFTPGCIPSVQEWLVANGHREQDPKALADIICQSLSDYIACYKTYPFFHAHDAHLFPAVRATLGDRQAELHLTALRSPQGQWLIGSPYCFTITDQYHLDRLSQEMQAATYKA